MAEDTPYVRIATPEDLDGVMALAMAVCAENAVTPPNPAKLLGEIWPSLSQNEGICGVIGPVGGPLEAVILLRAGALWYSDVVVLSERSCFVHPDFRSAKGGRAKLLCEFSKQAADTLGLPLLIGILSSERTRAKCKLYERIFGEPAGAFFMYGVKTGAMSGAVP